MGKPSLEKCRNAIEIIGHALHFVLNLLLKSTVCIGEIAWVNWHPMTCLSRWVQNGKQDLKRSTL